MKACTAKSSKNFAVEKRKNMNQSVSGVLLLNKPHIELSGFIKKKNTKNKKNGTCGGIRTPVTGVAACNAAD